MAKTLILSDDNDTIEELGFEGYAALWGCDPMYDKAPREPGDGYLFYNFGVEQSKEFYEKFIPAIQRTIEENDIGGRFKGEEKAKNDENLRWLKKEVEERLACLKEKNRQRSLAFFN